jgi:phenylacetic acid degradation operon negative regulatory protein
MPESKGEARRHLEHLLATRPPRAKSLVVTVFGDSILPHGGTIWVGSLIRLLEPFGVNERGVRTAVRRLTVEGWLTNRSVGRRSDYQPTAESRPRFDEADRRIYAGAAPAWDGTWCLVLLGQAGISTAERDAARRELRWHGFGEISPTLLLHPAADTGALWRALDGLHLNGKAIVFEGVAGAALAPESQDGRGALREVARSAWRLDELALGYRDFLDRFGPLDAMGDGILLGDPQTCFGLRTLAIHEYRRILLRDPELPEELLPERWEGSAARNLCARLYHRLEKRASHHLITTCETASGRLPPVSSPSQYCHRFDAIGEAALRRTG